MQQTLHLISLRIKYYITNKLTQTRYLPKVLHFGLNMLGAPLQEMTENIYHQFSKSFYCFGVSFHCAFFFFLA